MKILIIGMNYIGDTIFITPIIRAIKKHYGENCTIDVINGSRGIDVLKENPYINNIIVRDENNLEFIKKANYDIGFAANTSFVSAPILKKANIPVRVGVNSECRGFLLTHKTSWKKHSRHIVDTILSILKPLNIKDDGFYTELFLSKEEEAFGYNKMKNYKNALIVHGGATRISKRYTHFIELIKEFKKEFNDVPVIIIGSKDDASFANTMKENINDIIDFTDKLTIRELISVIKYSYALIGGDSAPLHIANALGIYSIGIFGDTLPLIYGVRGDKAFNIEAREKYCNKIKSFHCEYIRRGCKTIDCLNKLDYRDILPYLVSIYKKL